MMTNSVICLEDRDRAREIARSAGRGYLISMVALYHDTIPPKEGFPVWPDPPFDLTSMDDDALDGLIDGGYMMCGTPDEVAEQIVAYEDVGCDQLVFGMPVEGMQHDEILETLELFGGKIIPEFDKDSEHLTAKYRATAQRKYPDFSGPPPTVEVDVIPESAILPLK